MRKAERLFQIIQILRRSSRPVTSAQLADELEVARRTIYRDIAHLIGQRVPIEGEAGFGYVLDPRYDMPPLMLTPEEIEAVLLGVQMVAKLGDAAITNAARDVIAKIASTLPSDLLPFIVEPAVSLKPGDVIEDLMFDSRPLRRAIREGRKIQMDYCAAFWGIATLGLVAMTSLRLTLPDIPAEPGGGMVSELKVLGRAPVLLALALTMRWLNTAQLATRCLLGAQLRNLALAPGSDLQHWYCSG